jgi:hypothetical protein
VAFTVPKVVEQVLRTVAPTLLSALLGPFAGIGSAIVTAALDAWLGPVQTSSTVQQLPAPGQPGGTIPTLGAATPAEIVQTVQKNLDDPDFILALRQAELDLARYERELGFRFAELEEKSRERAGDFQTQAQIASPLMKWGMAIVVISIGAMFGVVIGSLLLVAGAVRIPAETAQMAVGVFGLIGAIVGHLSSYGTQVLGFYYGSSAGSAEKTERMSETMRDMGAALGDAATKPSPPTPPPPPPVVVVPPVTMPVPPVTPPAAASDWKQGPYGGARWRITEDGYVLVEGDARPQRTVGEPVTVRRIFAEHGHLIMEACRKHAVPAELVVCVIATESRGNADAILQEPDGRASGGLMQVTNTTGSEVLGRTVTADDLKDPQTNIEAGVAYLAQQRPITGFDPVLASAAYNAGGLHPPRAQDKNRFKLRSTADHLDRAVLWWNDVCYASKSNGWFKQPAA